MITTYTTVLFVHSRAMVMPNISMHVSNVSNVSTIVLQLLSMPVLKLCNAHMVTERIVHLSTIPNHGAHSRPKKTSPAVELLVQTDIRPMGAATTGVCVVRCYRASSTLTAEWGNHRNPGRYHPLYVMFSQHASTLRAITISTPYPLDKSAYCPKIGANMET